MMNLSILEITEVRASSRKDDGVKFLNAVKAQFRLRQKLGWGGARLNPAPEIFKAAL